MGSSSVMPLVGVGMGWRLQALHWRLSMCMGLPQAQVP
jgi:hypothetical protein